MNNQLLAGSARTRWAAATGVVLLCVALAPLSAQQVKMPSGNAYGAMVRTSGTESRLADVAMPADGGANSAEAVAPTSGGFTASNVTAVSSGDASVGLAGAQSVATASNVNVLNGLIRASRVIAVVMVTESKNKSAADADGSSIEGLTVNGAAVSDPAPNTRMDITGGYVILNEQIRGRGSRAAMTVNMIHVYMTNGDEIVVGSATTSM